MSTQPPNPILATPHALTPADPAKVSDYWLDTRLIATPAGCAYAAHDDHGNSVMLILTSEGAAGDPAARSRLAGEVNKLHIDTVLARGGEGQDEGRLGHRFRPENDDPPTPGQAPLAPWVALDFDGSKAAVDEAHRILTAVDLSRTPQLGGQHGPDYQLHWKEQTDPGPNRMWPLPWPDRGDRAGWRTILASWLLMILLAALAVLIAIVVFRREPPQAPPPPVPTQVPNSGGNGSGEPATPQSASPTDGSNSRPSDAPSMESPSPAGTASGQGTPTPNRKL